MSNFFMGIWNFFSGKKRVIALIYWSIVTPSLIIIWPEQVPAVVAKISAITGLALTALGLGHAAVKSSAAKNAEVTDKTEESA